jgi:hypothetical protein
VIIGGIGAFFGLLIKAGVSRQREYLADASAVQFTRNPGGISDALRAIGSHSQAALLVHPAADEASHMYFGDGVNAFFATHPPLEERIRRIDPGWDGSYPEATKRKKPKDDEASRPPVPPRLADALATSMLASEGITPETAAMAASLYEAGEAAAHPPVSAAALDEAVAWLGTLADAHIARAIELRDQIPEGLLTGARSTYGARAVLYALMLDTDEGIRDAELAYLRDHAEAGMGREAARFEEEAKAISVEVRLPLVEIAVGALKGLTTRQASEFGYHMRQLEAMDQHTSLFEWLVRRLLHRHLADAKQRVRSSKPGRRKLSRCAEAASKVLSAQAYASHRDEAKVEEAFAAGAKVLEHLVTTRRYPREECAPESLDRALLALDQLRPSAKRALITACARIAADDGRVRPAEVELMRALAAALSCPMPPLVMSKTA